MSEGVSVIPVLLRLLFEREPLRKKVKAAFPLAFSGLTLPPVLNMDCSGCGSSQTFRVAGAFSSFHAMKGLANERNERVGGNVAQAVYHCAGCGWPRVFLLEFGPGVALPPPQSKAPPPIIPVSGASTLVTKTNGLRIEASREVVPWVWKVGQYPSWSPTLDGPTERLVKEYGELYRRGLECEGEGYGLAASAYYRRIVEGIIEKLIAQRDASLQGQKQATFRRSVTAARKTRQMEKLIKLAKDQLPQAARPGSKNPLSVLYDRLSKTIHVLDDEASIAELGDLRALLLGLLRQIAHQGDTQAYAALLQRLSS